MSSSMRAGGIHWAATLDAGDFSKGAAKVKSEATRLQSELKSIQSRFKDSPFAVRALSDRAAQSDKLRAAERERFQLQTRDNMKKTIEDLAAFERGSAAIAAKSDKNISTFSKSVGALFGSGGGLQQFAALAKGGAALAGINVAVDSLGRLAQGASDLRVEMSQGNWTFGQKLEGFVQTGMKSVPIFDKIFESGGRFFDLADGWANGKPFASLAADAKKFESVIGDIRDTAVDLDRKLRDLRDGGKTSPANAIRDKFGDDAQAMTRRLFTEDQAGLSDEQRKQLWAGFNLNMDKLRQIRDQSLERQSAKDSGWSPFGGIAEDLRNRGKTMKRMVENAVTGWLFDYEKGVDAATKRWADRFTVAGNTVTRWLKNLEKDRDAFNDAAERAKRREKDDFISGAAGIFERLKSEQNAPLTMTPGLQFGTQDEYASRIQRMFSNVGGGKSDKEIAKESVEIQKRELETAKTIADLIRNALRDVKVAGVN